MREKEVKPRKEEGVVGERRRTSGMRLQREKERVGGSKEVSDLLTVYASPGVPATSQEFPKWQSRHHLPSLTQSFLFHPLVQPPILLTTAVASTLSTTSMPLPPLLLLLLLLGCCTLFIPFVGARALLSFDGESERNHVPWRATASFNWDAVPQL